MYYTFLLNNKQRIAEYAPVGVVRTKEQYNYLKKYSEVFQMPFLFTKKHRRKFPTFKEIRGRYVSVGTFFFWETNYFFYIKPQAALDIWSYGPFGKIEF